MSRRNGGVEHVDGMVRLDCPSAHVVGWLWRPHGRDMLVVFDPQRTRGVPAGSALRFTCPVCRHDGKSLDLRMALDRAETAAVAAAEDRTTMRHVVVLGS